MGKALAAASKRIRQRSGFGPRKVGRPRKAPVAEPTRARSNGSRPPAAASLEDLPIPTVDVATLPPRVTTVSLPPRLLTTRGAASYLSVSRGTIRNLLARGELQGVRLPGTTVLRFDTADLDKLVERAKQTPVSSDGRSDGHPTVSDAPR
jgi:excisionase family DNA binding protein